MKEIKNIAVLFSGQPRMIEESAKFLKQFFDLSSAGIETDYFFHLWDSFDSKSVTSQKGSGATVIRDADSFNHNDLESLVRDLYGPVFIQIDDQNTDPKFLDLKVKLKNTLPLLNEQTDAFKNILKNGWFKHFTQENIPPRFNLYFGQFESASRVSEQVPIFEKKLNKKYDICIRMRTDMVFTYADMNITQKVKEFTSLADIMDEHRARGLLNPVFVTYIKFPNGLPQVGDHYFVGDGQSISSFNRNASLGVISHFKKLFKIGMAEGFNVPDLHVHRENKSKGGPDVAHRAVYDPAEVSWAYLAFKNFTTIITQSKPFMDHMLIRSNVTPKDSVDDIKLKWKQWSNEMTLKIELARKSKHKSTNQ